MDGGNRQGKLMVHQCLIVSNCVYSRELIVSSTEVQGNVNAIQTYLIHFICQDAKDSKVTMGAGDNVIKQEKKPRHRFNNSIRRTGGPYNPHLYTHQPMAPYHHHSTTSNRPLFPSLPSSSSSSPRFTPFTEGTPSATSGGNGTPGKLSPLTRF
jgi:hypothetical protein